jgi:hypothetical protein
MSCWMIPLLPLNKFAELENEIDDTLVTIVDAQFIYTLSGGFIDRN